ncbi:hypothetical protein QQ045_015087 [Rhodiola kirilowii]
MLINGVAMAALPHLKVDYLARVASDHCPLLISFGNSTRKPAGYKYLRAWHFHAEFLDVVKEAWRDKAKVNWIAEGDRNSKIFNVMIKARRAQYSVNIELADGSFTEDRQGVRQGDPISPSHFILSMEMFSRLLYNKIRDGSILPFFVKPGALPISHLLYADDMLLFTNGSMDSVESLMGVFHRFCTWSGQRLNTAKSLLFIDQNVDVDSKQALLQYTGFLEGSLPTTYLGAPLFPGRVKIQYFSALEDRVRKRITRWLRHFLSMAGRVTLIKAILNSVLIHTLASLPTPSTVVDRITGMLSNFLWDQNAAGNAIGLTGMMFVGPNGKGA